MSDDFEELLDLLGANTVDLRGESASVSWSVSEHEGAVNERLQVSLRVMTKPRDDELRPFTNRYREGSVTLMPLKGEHKRNDEGQPVVGVLGQSNDNLTIRVLVSPTYLAGLSALVVRFAGAPITISVWPYKKLSAWNGEGWLHVRHCEIAVGFINISTRS
jgi:hypothetical protein